MSVFNFQSESTGRIVLLIVIIDGEKRQSITKLWEFMMLYTDLTSYSHQQTTRNCYTRYFENAN